MTVQALTELLTGHAAGQLRCGSWRGPEPGPDPVVEPDRLVEPDDHHQALQRQELRQQDSQQQELQQQDRPPPREKDNMSRLPIRPAALAAAAAGLSYAALRQRPPGRRRRPGPGPTTAASRSRCWKGPAVAIGGMAGALAARGLTGRERAAMLVAGAAAAALGGYDDLAGSGSSRGFRGHLGALRRGELTTGAVKLAGHRRGGPGGQRPARPGRQGRR